MLRPMKNIRPVSLLPKKEESPVLKGIVTIEHYRKGILLSREVILNTITNSGKRLIANIMSEAPSPATALVKWLAIGNSSTAAAASDTTLIGEITTGSLARSLATLSKVTTSVAGDTRRLVHTFTKDFSTPSVTTIREVGVFDTSTANTRTMLGRTTFTEKNLSLNDTLKVTYDIQVS